ncbi:hypothetical protein KEM52_002009 [Ascosphaera acerosa]|nr:hypothetical protein KEM52_002009 [Ascosphaera acerosa]
MRHWKMSVKSFCVGDLSVFGVSACLVSSSKLLCAMYSSSSWAMRAWKDRSRSGRGSRGRPPPGPLAMGACCVKKELWPMGASASDGRERMLLRRCIACSWLLRVGIGGGGIAIAMLCREAATDLRTEERPPSTLPPAAPPPATAAALIDMRPNAGGGGGGGAAACIGLLLIDCRIAEEGPPARCEG